MKASVVFAAFLCAFATLVHADLSVGYEKEQYDQIIEEIETLQDDAAKLRAYLEYKQKLHSEYLQKVADLYKVNTGEAYTEVSEKEAAKIVKNGLKGITKYLSSGGKDKVGALDAIRKQVTSLKKINDAEYDFIMSDKKLDAALKGEAVLRRQIEKATIRLDDIEKNQIPALEKEVYTDWGQLWEDLTTAVANAAGMVAQCQAYKNSKTSEYIDFRRVPWTITTTDEDGNSTTTSDEYCFAKIRSYCAAISPYQWCKCLETISSELEVSCG